MKLLKEDVKFRAELKKLLFPGREDATIQRAATSPSLGNIPVTSDVNNDNDDNNKFTNVGNSESNDEELKSEIEIKENINDVDNNDDIIIIG